MHYPKSLSTFPLRNSRTSRASRTDVYSPASAPAASLTSETLQPEGGRSAPSDLCSVLDVFLVRAVDRETLQPLEHLVPEEPECPAAG